MLVMNVSLTAADKLQVTCCPGMLQLKAALGWSTTILPEFLPVCYPPAPCAALCAGVLGSPDVFRLNYQAEVRQLCCAAVYCALCHFAAA